MSYTNKFLSEQEADEIVADHEKRAKSLESFRREEGWMLAVHESAHAVAGYVLGVKMGSTTISGYEKSCWFVPGSAPTQKAMGIMALAGDEAEKLAGAAGGNLSMLDSGVACEAALKYTTASGVPQLLDKWRVEARELLRQEWPSILRIAHVLEAEKTISSARLDELMIARTVKL